MNMSEQFLVLSFETLNWQIVKTAKEAIRLVEECRFGGEEAIVFSGSNLRQLEIGFYLKAVGDEDDKPSDGSVL